MTASRQILDRTTRGITGADGQIVKVSPWGRRRLAYPIGATARARTTSSLFDAPPAAIEELEHGLNITEEVMRHLVTRIERPPPPRRTARARTERRRGRRRRRPRMTRTRPDGEFIDESESEAAPRRHRLTRRRQEVSHVSQQVHDHREPGS